MQFPSILSPEHTNSYYYEVRAYRNDGTLAGIDPHSPRHLRVVGPVSTLDAFRDAFGLADDAPIMRPPEDRIEIW